MPEVSDTSTRLCTGGKINLFLRITGVRPDGYHDLSTLFVRLPEPCDELIIRPAAGTGLRLRCAEPGIDPACNTLTKAYALYAEATGFAPGLDAELVKGIPHGAGLGGGSADAAAVLVGLNELYGARLSAAELCALGAQVGADVPFSIVGGTARVTGVGDILEPLKPCPPCFFTVCMPAGGISTPQAYARYDRIGTDVRPDSAAAAAAIARGDLAGLCAQMKNALEYSSASAATKPICETLRAHGALAALMTGSGAAVFGVFADEAPAQAAKAALLRVYPQCWVLRPEAKGARVVGRG